jgi:hypothetical protein
MDTTRPRKSGAQRIDYKEAEQMLRSDRTQREVADHFGVTQAAVSAAIRRGVIKHEYDHLAKGRAMPWKVRTEHQNHYLARMLRAYHRRQQGLTSAAPWEYGLGNFLRAVERDNFVVTYEPDTDQGFFRVHRRPGFMTTQ